MNKELWIRCVDFHGHECPGLAIGYRACEAAIEKMNIGFSKDEEIVCITENDACGVDAIQVIMGCTLGKGNLLYRGSGKQAFSFFDRQTGDGLRILLKPFNREISREEKQEILLNFDINEIFEFSKPKYELPEKARIFKSIKCDICGEVSPEHKMRFNEGQVVCFDCFEEYNRGW